MPAPNTTSNRPGHPRSAAAEHHADPPTHEQHPPAALIPFDAGWFFLLAGLMIAGSVVLIPASRDLTLARAYRERILAVETHRLERLQRHEQYLAAVDQNDPQLLRSLAIQQLNLIPEGRSSLGPAAVEGPYSASVFLEMEPEPLVLPADPPVRSTLERWMLDGTVRLWATAAAGLCLLIGLLPPSTPRNQAPQDAEPKRRRTPKADRATAQPQTSLKEPAPDATASAPLTPKARRTLALAAAQSGVAASAGALSTAAVIQATPQAEADPRHHEEEE